jgi:hypothetical protein
MSEENILTLFTSFISKNANYASDTIDDLPGNSGPRISSQFGALNNPKTSAPQQGGSQQGAGGIKPITDTSKPLALKTTSTFLK